jgi:hypothetical protein
MELSHDLSKQGNSFLGVYPFSKYLSAVKVSRIFSIIEIIFSFLLLLFLIVPNLKVRLALQHLILATLLVFLIADLKS